jgi:hypothetical protein
MLNFDFWDKEWPVITGAPHIVLGGLFILIVAIFLLVRWPYSREIAGLKAESAALNERLRLAHDQQAGLTNQVDTLTSQLVELRQLAQTSPFAQLADKASTTAREISTANLALGRTLTPGEFTTMLSR